MDEVDATDAREPVDWSTADAETCLLELERSATFGQRIKSKPPKVTGRLTPERPTICRGGFAAVVELRGGFRADDPGHGDARVVDVDLRDPGAGFGVLRSIELQTKSEHSPGLLVLRLDLAKHPEVDPGGARVLRWRDDVKSYELVGSSGLADGSFGWAMVAGGGHYIVVAPPRDETIRGVLGAMERLDPVLADVDPEAVRKLRERLLDLMLETLPAPDGQDDHRAAVASLGSDTVQTQLAAAAQVPVSGYWTQPAWECVGPMAISGQVTDLAVCPGPQTVLYATSAGGGVWRAFEHRDERGHTTAVDDWHSWDPVTPDFASSPAIGVEESRPEVIYVAPRPTPRSPTSPEGTRSVMRSDDGGISWRTVATRDFGDIRRIIVHPTERETVLVACASGLWFSSDGGRSWAQRFLSGDVTDAVIDRVAPHDIYFAVRHEGVYKYRTGPRPLLVLPWSRAVNPTSTMIRIALGRQGDPAHRTVVAKLAQQIFVHRHSAEPGYQWRDCGILDPDPVHDDSGQGDLNHVVAVDPFNDDRWLAGQQNLQFTKDGGRTWIWVAGYDRDAHADQWRVVFDPVQRDRAYLANDGGVWVSTNGGMRWWDYNAGLATTAMFQAGISGSTVVAGTYHWGVLVTHAFDEDWSSTEGGAWECTRQYADPTAAGRFYVLGSGLVPFLFSRAVAPHVGNIGYANFGAQCVIADWRQTSQAMLVGTSDGRVMRTLERDVEIPRWNAELGIELDRAQADIIISFAAAPMPARRPRHASPFWVYAVSALGRVFYKSDITSDERWTERGQWHATLGAPNFGSTIGTHIAVNALYPERVYLISNDSFARSFTGGRGPWTVANGTGLHRHGGDTRSLVAHPTDGRTVYICSVGDVQVSHDEGDSWASMRNDLPYVQADYIEARDGYLYCSTYGRALWRRRI